MIQAVAASANQVGVNPCTSYFGMSPIEEANARSAAVQIAPITFYQGQGWEVTSRADSTILDAATMDCWCTEFGVTTIPDIISGASVVTLRHVASGTVFHYDAHDALAAAAQGWKRAKAGGQSDADKFQAEFAAMPGWKNKRELIKTAQGGHADAAADGEALVAFDQGIEWTYRTPYTGTIRRTLTSRPPGVKEGEGTIDWDLLKDQSQPIKAFGAVELFEDELADCGRSKLSVKMRFMPTCWFVLMRQFVRVDRVRVWIRDVRHFHRHNSGVVVEEVTERSMTIADMSGKAEDLAAAARAAETGERLPTLRTYNNIDELANTVPVVSRSIRTITL
eukprot:Hpha_TRINITY_DN3099_c0_g1::TRINITY_DN3099_c0_g1_i1::g.138623::m.138623/K17607/TIPRL, TIP41; type 2A phosphatase activator TIP41